MCILLAAVALRDQRLLCDGKHPSKIVTQHRRLRNKENPQCYSSYFRTLYSTYSLAVERCTVLPKPYLVGTHQHNCDKELVNVLIRNLVHIFLCAHNSPGMNPLRIFDSFADLLGPSEHRMRQSRDGQMQA